MRKFQEPRIDIIFRVGSDVIKTSQEQGIDFDTEWWYDEDDFN